MKNYLVVFSYEDSNYRIEVKADSFEEAEKKVRKMNKKYKPYFTEEVE